MEVTRRFEQLCRLPEGDVPLDEAAALIAAHAHPGLDVARPLAELDRLAATCPGPTTEDLVGHLFGDGGFQGDRRNYYDPANSYLDDVLDRRLGIPITLSVVAMSVGRRIGLDLVGVSLPGHFVTRDVAAADRFLDAFAGELIDTAGCVRAFRRVHGDGAPFDPSWLTPVGTFSILSRMLANLRSIFLAREDRRGLTWCLALRSVVPGSEGDRSEYAAVLAATGRFSEAASVHDALAERARARGEDDDSHLRAAARLRARLN